GDGLVGGADEGRLAIWVRVDGDRRDAHRTAGAHDAGGDLAAVGDEDLFDGAHRRWARGQGSVISWQEGKSIAGGRACALPRSSIARSHGWSNRFVTFPDLTATTCAE